MKSLPEKLKPLVYVLLFFVSWQFLQLYNFCHAFEPNSQTRQVVVTPWDKLRDILSELETVLESISTNLAAEQDISYLLTLYDEEVQKIIDLNLEIRSLFQEEEISLRNANVSDEILSRHYQIVERYENDKSFKKQIDDTIENYIKSDAFVKLIEDSIKESIENGESI